MQNPSHLSNYDRNRQSRGLPFQVTRYVGYPIYLLQLLEGTCGKPNVVSKQVLHSVRELESIVAESVRSALGYVTPGQVWWQYSDEAQDGPRRPEGRIGLLRC